MSSEAGHGSSAAGVSLSDSFEEFAAGEDAYDILEQRYGREVAEVAEEELGGEIPRGDPADRAAWVEARLYRLVPEQFYSAPFDSDHLNAIYSSARAATDGSKGIVSDTLAERRIDLDRHDAVVLDHSAVFQVFDREDVSYYDPEQGRSTIGYVEAMQFLDEVLGSRDAVLYVPSDLREKVDGDPNHWENEEPRKLLENAAYRFDIVEDLSVSEGEVSDKKREDFGIGEAAEGLGVNPVVATYDSDFLAIANVYDIDIGVPVTGDENADLVS